MNDYTLTIQSYEKKGVLDNITDVISSHGANISYVHLFVEKNNNYDSISIGMIRKL